MMSLVSQQTHATSAPESADPESAVPVSAEPTMIIRNEEAKTPLLRTIGRASLWVVRWLPRICVNTVLIGIVSLLLMLMWAPGYIGQSGERSFRMNRPNRPQPVWRWGSRSQTLTVPPANAPNQG